jgi:hypothetical protein
MNLTLLRYPLHLFEASVYVFQVTIPIEHSVPRSDSDVDGSFVLSHICLYQYKGSSTWSVRDSKRDPAPEK